MSPTSEEMIKEVLNKLLNEISIPPTPLFPIFDRNHKLALTVVGPDGKELATIGDTPCSLSNGMNTVKVSRNSDDDEGMLVQICTEFKSEVTDNGQVALDLDCYENSIALAFMGTHLIFSLASVFVSSINSKEGYRIGGFIVPVEGDSTQQNFLLSLRKIELKETSIPTKTKVRFTFEYKEYVSDAFTSSQIEEAVNGYYFTRLDNPHTQVH